MLPDLVSNPGPLTYESGALPIALRGPAPRRVVSSQSTHCHITELYQKTLSVHCCWHSQSIIVNPVLILLHSEWPKLYGVLAVLSAIQLSMHPWEGQKATKEFASYRFI